jgi:hypothetical protein
MIVICLVNTYDKLKLHEIHLRSIARAAPLCYAFDFHLALLDFPFWKRTDEVVENICNYTTIGGYGECLRKLDEKGRFHLIEKIPAHFGDSVATTSKPDEKKALKPEEIMKFNSATFLIGLGRRGLPSELLKSSKYHLDVTQKGISLETCTAIGAITMMVHLYRVVGWKR